MNAALSAPARVTAIVVVRNGEKFVAEAIASIRNQTLPPWEILVLDGGSTDRTAAIVQAMPGVRLCRQTGTGLAQARNQAIAEAGGDVIAFLDHDDLWLPEKLAIQVPMLMALPAPAFSTGRLRFFGASPSPGQREAGRAGRTPGTLVAHRQLFDAIGGFFEGLTVGCDMDWFVRAALAGVPNVALREAVLLKRLHGGNLSASADQNLKDAFAVIARSLPARRRQRTRPSNG